MNNKTAIRIKNLTKTFNLTVPEKLKDFLIKNKNYKKEKIITALSDINLEIKSGEFIGIIGPNGAGKSTLLKMMSNIYYPDVGSVEVYGNISPFLELQVGFLPDLSAYDNLFFYGALLHMTRQDIKSAYEDIVDFAEIKDHIRMQYKNLSTGMQMRLGFSLTIHTHSEIFLIDEALSVGDENFQKKCVRSMKKLNDEGKTMLFVSHDLNLIRNNCERVFLMDKGKIIDSGNPKKIVSKYLKCFYQKR